MISFEELERLALSAYSLHAKLVTIFAMASIRKLRSMIPPSAGGSTAPPPTPAPRDASGSSGDASSAKDGEKGKEKARESLYRGRLAKQRENREASEQSENYKRLLQKAEAKVRSNVYTVENLKTQLQQSYGQIHELKQ